MGSSGNSRVGMGDEGIESARFALQHMRGVSPSSSLPAFQTRVKEDGKRETSKAAPAKTSGQASIPMLALPRKVKLRRGHLTTWRRRRRDKVVPCDCGTTDLVVR